MSNEQLSTQDQQIYDNILVIVTGVMSLQFFAVVLLFLGIFTLFLYSKRPGTKIMFICTMLALISIVLNYGISLFVESQYDQVEFVADFYFNQLVSWSWSLLEAIFICFGCYGFFKFSRSFKTEKI